VQQCISCRWLVTGTPGTLDADCVVADMADSARFRTDLPVVSRMHVRRYRVLVHVLCMHASWGCAVSVDAAVAMLQRLQ
jgi:hypothetical protein